MSAIIHQFQLGENIVITPMQPNLATDISGSFCGSGGKPAITVNDKGGRVLGEGRGLSANLPLTNTRMEDAAGTLDFAASGTIPPQGTIRNSSLVQHAANFREDSPVFTFP